MIISFYVAQCDLTEARTQCAGADGGAMNFHAGAYFTYLRFVSVSDITYFKLCAPLDAVTNFQNLSAIVPASCSVSEITEAIRVEQTRIYMVHMHVSQSAGEAFLEHCLPPNHAVMVEPSTPILAFARDLSAMHLRENSLKRFFFIGQERG